MKNLIPSIRAILTGLLIYKCYEETGFFTALALTLIFVAIELINNKINTQK